eukprot:5790928-Amphidinium_carterae.2
MKASLDLLSPQDRLNVLIYSLVPCRNEDSFSPPQQLPQLLELSSNLCSLRLDIKMAPQG